MEVSVASQSELDAHCMPILTAWPGKARRVDSAPRDHIIPKHTLLPVDELDIMGVIDALGYIADKALNIRNKPNREVRVTSISLYLYG